MLRNGDRAKTIEKAKDFVKSKYLTKAEDRAKAKSIAKSGKNHGSTSQELRL